MSHGYTRRMESPTHADELQPLTQALAAQPDLLLALVFGSLAAGTAGPDSDADVAILAQDALDARRQAGLIELIAQVTGRPVDLVDLREAGVLVQRSALGSGRLLFCRDQRAYELLVSRMITDSEDFLPLLERFYQARREAWIG